jgi:hypothetical protein
MSSQGGGEKQRNSKILANIYKEEGETNEYRISYDRRHEETQPVKLTDIFGQVKAVAHPLPHKPVPKRKYLRALQSDSEPSDDGHIESPAESFSAKEHLHQFTSSSMPQQDDHEIGNRSTRPFMIPSQLEYHQPLPEDQVVGPMDCGGRTRHSLLDHDRDQDQQQKSLRKDKYVDTSLWHKLLHPEQRHVKRCRPSENRFDPSEEQGRLHDAGSRKMQAVEEGIGPLHITEERPVRAEKVDEQIKNVELRVKKRVDSVGTDCLKEIGRQLEIIEQGQLANLHLDPADEDPMFAAAIPRPDVYSAEGSDGGGTTAFHRGEPVRSSAGGVIETSGKSWSRPRTHSDNAGPLSPDINVATPSRRGFGRTPVRRHSKSPTSSPVPRRILLSDDIVRTGNRNNISYEVCYTLLN